MDRVLRVDPTRPPDPSLLNLMFYSHIASTFILFYAYGYLVLPSLLNVLVFNRATGKWLKKKLWFVGLSTVAVYVLFNFYDYYLFSYAFNQFKPVPAYIQRNYDLLHVAGPLGIFVKPSVYTVFSLFTFIWAYNISYLNLPLLIRIVREAISWGVVTVDQKAQIEDLNDMQMNHLKQQINPHFLFNVFNNIYALIHQTNEQAARLLRGLTELMQYTLYETNKHYVPLAGELTFLTNYINIEKSRQFKPERICYQIKGDASNYLIPPLLLVTFVENAFKHGLNKSFEEGWVNVELDIQNQSNSLRMKVANNLTTDGKKNIRKEGIGLVNTKKRLDGLFGADRFLFSAREEAAEYHVELTLPLRTETTNG